MTEFEPPCDTQLLPDEATGLWGWTCWTHGAYFDGYSTPNEAETASENCALYLMPRPRPFLTVHLPEEDVQ